MRPSWQRCGRQENERRLSPSVSRFVDPPFPRTEADRFSCVYTRRGFRRSSVSRGDSGPLHVATVILFSFRWNRPVFPSVSKLNGNHADLGSISRCDKTGRDSIQRYELLQYLSLSLCPFFSGFEIFSRSKKFPSVFSTRDIRDIRQV